MNILLYAIEMEQEGEKFYRDQAEINKNNHIHKICISLAEDEKTHAGILQNKLNSLNFELKDTDLNTDYKSLFKEAEDIKVESKEMPSQLDFYRKASEMEKRSIELYKDLLLKTQDMQEKEIFQFLVKQEEQHYELLDGLAEMLRKSEEWVEFAEFGMRDEY